MHLDASVIELRSLYSNPGLVPHQIVILMGYQFDFTLEDLVLGSGWEEIKLDFVVLWHGQLDCRVWLKLGFLILAVGTGGA